MGDIMYAAMQQRRSCYVYSHKDVRESLPVVLMVFPRKRFPEAGTRTQVTATLKRNGSGCLPSIVRTENLMENRAILLHAVKFRLLHTVTRYVQPSLVYDVLSISSQILMQAEITCPFDLVWSAKQDR